MGARVARRLEVEKDALLLDYASGQTMKNIGDRFGCGITPVRAFLKRHGVAIRQARPKVLMRKADNVKALYATGLGPKAIAGRLGVNRNTVSDFLAEHGLLRGVSLHSREFFIASDCDRGMLAGLLIGEGSIIVRGRGAAIRIYNQDAAIIGWLAKHGGKVHWSKPSPKVGRKNPCAVWALSRSVDVFHCLTSIGPLLVGKKKNLAKAALNVLKQNYGFQETA